MATRATVSGRVQGVGFREFTRARALDLGLTGWVRNEEDGSVRLHAEGSPEAVEALLAMVAIGPPAARVAYVDPQPVPDEGHEQFAVRGVPAGLFSVVRTAGDRPGYELCLEVDGALRVWTLPREPSMDPAVRRLAIERPLRALEDQPAAPVGSPGLWDRGRYEQGGRVPWPEAIRRGHAVFVLHGRRLSGGFALQRTRPAADAPLDAAGDGGSEVGTAGTGWLLIKRRERAG